jgi:topoisomerase-4 subunit A
MRTRFASGPLGARRTRLAEAPPPAAEAVEAALAVREPVTVVCSEKGWIRALKGHLADIAGLKFKEGDRLFAAVPAWTTDRLLAFGTNGRAYTIAVDRLPGGRGDGVPIRLLIDLPNDATLIGLRVQPAEGRFLVAGAKGRGFIVPAEELVAATKAGKQVLALDLGEEAVVCAPVPEGADHVATIGENRKLLIFPLDELPVLAKGRGVALQKFKQGGLADAKPFALGEGLAVRLGESRVSVRTKGELAEWLGHRAGAGRLPWRGFPSSGRFG